MWKISSGAFWQEISLLPNFCLPPLSMNEILAKSKITVTPRTPYSPHLVLYDFRLFRKLTDDVKSNKI
jgi:hypothetical protein